MLTKFLLAASLLVAAPAFAQTLTWSSTQVTPKEKDLFTDMTFPGVVNDQYLVVESDAGGVSFNRKIRTWLQTASISNLNPGKDQSLSDQMTNGDSKGDEHVENRHLTANGKMYSFFLKRADKGVYTIHALVQNIGGGLAQPPSLIHKMDLSKGTADKSGAYMNTLFNGMNLAFEVAANRTSIVGACIAEATDKENAILTVTEWDANMKVVHTNNYTIPYKEYRRSTWTLVGNVESQNAIQPSVRQVMKDNDGFVYVLVRSANPQDKTDGSKYYLYQLKPSDGTYKKEYKKELLNQMAPAQVSLFQESDGKVCVAAMGYEMKSAKDKDEEHRVNMGFIGSFGKDGQLETVMSGRFPVATLYHFDETKQVDKRGYVNIIAVRNILPTKEGGYFVVLEREWVELKNNYGEINDENVLVQYYKDKKLQWEKPVYKRQVAKTTVFMQTISVQSGLVDDQLYLFYPDESRNAPKAVDDQEVEKFSVVKFGNKDLTGMFVATFSTAGSYTRKYISWPEDKQGYALCVYSVKHIGNKEFMGVVRKVRQGAIMMKQEEYAFFKLKF